MIHAKNYEITFTTKPGQFFSADSKGGNIGRSNWHNTNTLKGWESWGGCWWGADWMKRRYSVLLTASKPWS